jgi:hypothetical protein
LTKLQGTLQSEDEAIGFFDVELVVDFVGSHAVTVFEGKAPELQSFGDDLLFPGDFLLRETEGRRSGFGSSFTVFELGFSLLLSSRVPSQLFLNVFGPKSASPLASKLPSERRLASVAVDLLNDDFFSKCPCLMLDTVSL